MFIRHAIESDKDGIVRGAQQFFDYAGFYDMGLPLDIRSFWNTVQGLMEHPQGIVLLLMDELKHAGCIAGNVQPYGFNDEILIGWELFWWVFPEYRGRHSIKLFRAFEDECIRLKANQIIMASVPTHLESVVEKLYSRMGYGVLEKLFIRKAGK